MFSTLHPCSPPSLITLSNKKIAIICAKKCDILHYLPLITQRHAKKIMRLNAIFPCTLIFSYPYSPVVRFVFFRRRVYFLSRRTYFSFAGIYAQDLFIVVYPVISILPYYIHSFCCLVFIIPES